MMYRVVRPFEYTGPTGQRTAAQTGSLVDIQMQKHVDDLMREGKVAPHVARSLSCNNVLPVAGKWARTLRVGIWLKTSVHYSGGRIHMYQYAWSLANAGAEVYFVTNAVPKWSHDYPANKNLTLLIDGEDSQPPEDLDLVVTDSKSSFGFRAFDWHKHHPWVPFVCMNFETPNWVMEFDAGKGRSLMGDQTVFEHADLLMANSRESLVYLKKWMNADGKHTAVMTPAINNTAIVKANNVIPQWLQKVERPFAVWCARGQAYKGFDVAVKSVFDLDTPFDLVIFGSCSSGIPDETDKHAVVNKNGLPDVDKFAAMRLARMVLAPSLFEGFGMIPSEALACGTPVIAYDLPVLRQEYGDTPGLQLIKHNDAKAFAQAVREAATAPKPTLDPKPIIQRFGLNAMAEQIDHIPYHTIKRPTITAQLVAYWGFLPEAVESIYNLVDQIVIAYGRVNHAPVLDDGSLALIKSLPDPDGKITLRVEERWPDKREMRVWCSSQAVGNRMLILDGDEIWDGLDEWILSGNIWGSPRWVNLWHGPGHWVHDAKIGTSPRWGGPLKPFGSPCPHYRWSQWRRSYGWKKHHSPVDQDGNNLTARNEGPAVSVPACTIYHLGHALPTAVMKAKHRFYLERDGNDAQRQRRQTAWHNWDGNLGDCGDGVVSPVAWELPPLVRKAFERMDQANK